MLLLERSVNLLTRLRLECLLRDLGGNNIIKNGALLKFQQECLEFYQVATTYLLEILQCDSKLIKHAQCLYH